jgi:hypothetical protein
MFADPGGHSASLRSARGLLDAFVARDANRAVQFLTEIRTSAFSMILDQLGANRDAAESQLFSAVPQPAFPTGGSRAHGRSGAGDES